MRLVSTAALCAGLLAGCAAPVDQPQTEVRTEDVGYMLANPWPAWSHQAGPEIAYLAAWSAQGGMLPRGFTREESLDPAAFEALSSDTTCRKINNVRYRCRREIVHTVHQDSTRPRLGLNSLLDVFRGQ